VVFSLSQEISVSHTVTIKTKITDLVAIQAACQRLKLTQPTKGEVRLFDRVAQGIGVHLDGWRFPICVESDGNLLYDNFGGFWGTPERLDQFQQMYAVCKATIEVRKQGYQCSESVLADGSVRLNVMVEA
jgi:hypothetical protein